VPKRSVKASTRVTDIYDGYIQDLNNVKVKSRYEGREEWYHSSLAGLCVRKHYFGSTMGMKGTSKDQGTMRLFRLGDLVHGDIQEAVRRHAEQTGASIYIEKELFIPELNVRGFIDLAFIDDNVMYDIKTCNSWKWRNMFGRGATEGSSENYKLQLGTYGYWYNQTHKKKLSGLYLCYYNKDNSTMKEVEIPLSIIDQARDYWLTVAHFLREDSAGNGLPPIELGISPMVQWECNPKYCSYFQECGGGLKPELLKKI